MDDTILGAGLPHRYALLVAYAITLLAWGRVAHRLAPLWPVPAPVRFTHPWREVGCFAVALLAVLAIGQLYVRHWLLPARGVLTPLLEALNQVLIFSPVLWLPFVRRHTLLTAGGPANVRAILASMWLPAERVWARILAGLVLSLIAVLAFTSVRSGSDGFSDVIGRVYHPRNLGHWVQVLCEDVGIAVLFVRIRAALGLTRTVVAVAVLFAAAHIPALVSGGAPPVALAGLAGDAALGAMVLWFLQRGGDVWWFAWVHFAMDMMQFHAGSPVS